MPGVYRSAQWPESLEQWCVATCARNPTSLISFTTGLKLWHRRSVDNRGVHSLVPHGASPEIPGIVVHRCRRIDPVDVVVRADGIRVASPPRCLFDAADMLGFTATRSVMEQMLRDEMCTVGTIADTVARLHHPNRPGSRTMLTVMQSKPKWQRALQSELELLVLLEIERQGLSTPVTQCPVQLPDGSVIHLDFGWPQWKVGLEVDDPAWHDGAAESQRDARRDRKAAVTGWIVPRISRLDVEGPLRDAVADVAQILRGRAA
jgi:very-short-patch-repair endonuclease